MSIHSYSRTNMTQDLKGLVLAVKALFPAKVFTFAAADEAVFNFDGTLDVGEIASLDAKVAEYQAGIDLDLYKTDKISSAQSEMHSYIEGKYPSIIRDAFIWLMNEGLHEGYTNRAAYIQSGWDWMMSVLTEYYIAKATIEAQVNQAGVDSVTWDYDQFTATDPLMLVAVAKATVD